MADDVTVAAPALAPLRYRVAQRRMESAYVVTLGLEPLDAAIEQGDPGQFHMMWAFGVGEVPISIAGFPADDGLVLHTVRAVGPVTAAILATEPGTVLGLRGPFGVGWGLDEVRGRDVLLVAGGIGLAPLRPAMVRVLRARDRFGRVTLLVGARTPEALLYSDELERWGDEAGVRVAVTVDHAWPGWRGPVGVVTRLVAREPVDPEVTVAFVCGPEIMMRFTVRELLARGIGPGSIRLSLERNMQCAIAQCGHCQLGPKFVCREGPVLSYRELEPLLRVPEL